MIKKFKVSNEFIEMNAYAIIDEGECFLVDPAFCSEEIAQFIANEKLTIKGVLLTHGHFDHIFGVGIFGVDVFVSSLDEQMLHDNKKNGFDGFGGNEPNITKAKVIKTFQPFDVFKVGKKEISSIPLAGHSLGSTAFSFENSLICGDTIFCPGVGRWDYFGGSFESLQDSVKKILETFNDETIIHPGHGESAKLGDVRAYLERFAAIKRKK